MTKRIKYWKPYAFIYLSRFMWPKERSLNRPFLLLLDLSIQYMHAYKRATITFDSCACTHALYPLFMYWWTFSKNMKRDIYTQRPAHSLHSLSCFFFVFVLLPWTSLCSISKWNSSGRASNILAWQPYSSTIPWNFLSTRTNSNEKHSNCSKFIWIFTKLCDKFHWIF